MVNSNELVSKFKLIQAKNNKKVTISKPPKEKSPYKLNSSEDEKEEEKHYIKEHRIIAEMQRKKLEFA